MMLQFVFSLRIKICSIIYCIGKIAVSLIYNIYTVIIQAPRGNGHTTLQRTFVYT